jgi:dihydroorotate dehydrogenase (NAD+) catalytic subunit
MTSWRLIGMNGSPDLSVQIGGLQLKNPVMPASGTFGYGEEYTDFLDPSRLGAVIVKTITLKPRTGSYPHRSTEVASGFLASIGLQNVGVEHFLREKLPYFDGIDVPLIVNIGGQSVEEYVALATIMNAQRRVNALELNISCPNVSKGGMHFGIDPEVTRELVTRVRAVTEKTVIVKLTPMVSDIRLFAEVCQEAGADSLSLINAPLGMSVDVKTRRSKLGRNMKGGLTGPAIKPLALYLVHQVSKSVDIPVIGIGGISSLEDALEFFIVGASAVQVGTWNFINPRITIEIIQGLHEYLSEHKIRAFRELVGTLL